MQSLQPFSVSIWKILMQGPEGTPYEGGTVTVITPVSIITMKPGTQSFLYLQEPTFSMPSSLPSIQIRLQS